MCLTILLFRKEFMSILKKFLSLFFVTIMCGSLLFGTEDDVTKVVKKDSHSGLKKLALSLNRMLSLDTRIDPSKTQISVVCLDKRELQYHTCSKDLENLELLRYIMLSYNGNTFIKKDKKYKGHRTSPIGKALANVMGVEKAATKQPLKDEYVSVPVWWLKFNDVTEFRQLAVYLEKILKDEQTTRKPMLMITLEDDLELNTLDTHDLEFIQKYFELVPFTNKDMRDFRNAIEKKCLTSRAEHQKAGAVYIDENFKERMFREITSVCEDFEWDRIAPKLALYGGSILVGTLILDKITNNAKTNTLKTTIIAATLFAGATYLHTKFLTENQ